MAEAVTISRPANDPSPSPAPSPAEPGLGGSGAEVEESAPQRDYEKDLAALRAEREKLQSERDRARHQGALYQQRYAEIQQEHASALARLEAIEARLSQPDVLTAPEQAVDHWRQQYEREKTRVRTEQKISSELQGLARRTGVIVTRDDARLDFSSEAGFRRSVGAIEKQISDARSAAQNEKAARKQLEAEIEAKVAKKYGVDRFDGGSTGGGSTGLTLTKYLGMSSTERMKLRRENPAAVDALMQRGR